MVIARSNPFLVVAIGTVILIARANIAFAQMGTRPELYYEEGGFQDDTTGFLVLVFSFVFYFFVLRAIVRSLEKSKREEDDRAERRKTLDPQPVRQALDSEETDRKPNTTTNRESPQESAEKRVLYYLSRVLPDEEACFYIIGVDEKPIVVWFRQGIAADFSKKLYEEVCVESIFGRSISMSALEDYEVGPKAFRNRVLEVHSSVAT
jgi:hypothetical protein